MSDPKDRIRRRGIGRLVHALRFSCEGLVACFREQEAFRLEVALAALLIPIATFSRATRLEKAALIVSVLAVLIVELLNSAIEAIVDRVSPEEHVLAKRAKDLGSAAVFVALIALAVVWALVFAPL